MIFVNVDTVFNSDWDVELTVKASTGFFRAILDAFSEGVVYISGGNEVEPDEAFSESIEAGINQVTEALNTG